MSCSKPDASGLRSEPKATVNKLVHAVQAVIAVQKFQHGTHCDGFEKKGVKTLTQKRAARKMRALSTHKKSGAGANVFCRPRSASANHAAPAPPAPADLADSLSVVPAGQSQSPTVPVRGASRWDPLQGAAACRSNASSSATYGQIQPANVVERPFALSLPVQPEPAASCNSSIRVSNSRSETPLPEIEPRLLRDFTNLDHVESSVSLSTTPRVNDDVMDKLRSLEEELHKLVASDGGPPILKDTAALDEPYHPFSLH